MTETPGTENQASETVAEETATAETTAQTGAQGAAADQAAEGRASVAAEERAAAEAAPAPEGEEASQEAPAAQGPGSAPAPAPAPRPVPKPSALPRPRPVVKAAKAPAVVAPPVDPAEEERAASFGRVAEDGTVYVREATGERAVGQMPEATPEEALSFYVRRYLDLVAKVGLFEARLKATDLTVKEIDQTLAHLTEDLTEPSAVGDVDGLRARLDALREVAAERRAAAEAARAAARAEALAARTAIVEKAEEIAARDPERTQWKQAGESLRELLEEWKAAQRSGPRIDRSAEEALWKRFSAARTTFDRNRRHYFAQLSERQETAKRLKEQIVAEAESLATSTAWGPTTGAFRELMNRWKAAGRAARKDDDALWARFRAAQDAFFSARDAANAATEEEYRANLQAKEEILAEAEALLPVTDVQAAKAALRGILDRWDAAGRVPRADVHRVESRMRAVEQAVREAEEAEWRRSNPEIRARAEGTMAQLEQAIAQLESELAAARDSGQDAKVGEIEAALEARRAWLAQVQKAAAEA